MSDMLLHIQENSFDPLFIAFAVFLIDGIMGDPKWFYSRIPHPVVVIGNAISKLEDRFNNPVYSSYYRFFFGILTVLIVVATFTVVGIVLTGVFNQIPGGALLIALVASSLIAYRGLFVGVRHVQKGLEKSLENGREAVSHIVGRDPDSLDGAGVARAAIESLAENFSDGTTAPLFWFLVFGLPGLLFYKSVNTLDSMIGHHSDRYEYFGKVAARLDDVVNYIPARLTGLLIVTAACLHPRMSGRGALQGLFRDARHHKSINAGWQEAAFAGAVGLSLAGPRQYGDQMVEDVWMNREGRKRATAQDISAALQLYLICGGLLFAGLVGTAVGVVI
ncbi:MAG: cobalamin biosynthesis protein CobD [Sneathiella sp.]|nr:cobalamin biosynthesis protein CobD [Sneathiella sp.]